MRREERLGGMWAEGAVEYIDSSPQIVQPSDLITSLDPNATVL